MPATRRARGNTAAIIRAEHERARRNLPDTWALRRSQPLVSIGPSGLDQTIGSRYRVGQCRSSTTWRGSRTVIHRPSTGRNGLTREPRSAGGPAGGWVQSAQLAVEAGEHQAPADQISRGDDVGMGDSPGDGSVRIDRE